MNEVLRIVLVIPNCEIIILNHDFKGNICSRQMERVSQKNLKHVSRVVTIHFIVLYSSCI